MGGKRKGLKGRWTSEVRDCREGVGGRRETCTGGKWTEDYVFWVAVRVRVYSS